MTLKKPLSKKCRYFEYCHNYINNTRKKKYCKGCARIRADISRELRRKYLK